MLCSVVPLLDCWSSSTLLVHENDNGEEWLASAECYVRILNVIYFSTKNIFKQCFVNCNDSRRLHFADSGNGSQLDRHNGLSARRRLAARVKRSFKHNKFHLNISMFSNGKYFLASSECQLQKPVMIIQHVGHLTFCLFPSEICLFAAQPASPRNCMPFQPSQSTCNHRTLNKANCERNTVHPEWCQTVGMANEFCKWKIICETASNFPFGKHSDIDSGRIDFQYRTELS